MTLEIFSRDIVPIIQLLVTALGLIGLFLLWWQIRQTNVGNKLNSFKEFLDGSRAYALEKELYRNLRAIDIDPSSFLTEDDVKNIHTNDDAHLAVKAFLNDIENLCAGIRIGAIDSEGAYAVHSARVIAIFDRYKKFIDAVRSHYNDGEIYIEIEKVALEWSRKHLKTQEQQKKRVEKLQQQLDAERGVKAKV